MKLFQKEIIANRVRRGWVSATDLSKTTLGLAEEVGEFEKARKSNDRDAMIDALGDIMVFCLGGCEILEVDAEEVVSKIIEANKNRTHTGNH